MQFHFRRHEVGGILLIVAYDSMKAIKKYHTKPAPRKHRVSIMLNDSEMRALERYCDQYTVKNRSRLIRETLMRNILKRFDKDSPTLFD